MISSGDFANDAPPTPALISTIPADESNPNIFLTMTGFTWILNHYAKPGYKILDTHVGSASSLIACYRAGLEYWGFETHKGYYQKATERLETEKTQIRMTF